MELSKAISAVLFYQAEPISEKRLATLLKVSPGDIRTALDELEGKLRETGITLLRKDDEVTLGTRAEASTLIEAITKEELSRDLSKASLETLAIILYRGPVTRGDIDYIRGVNSTFILRNLLIRGLIERVENPNDQRSFLYRPTFAMLEYMGVSRVEELPEYDVTMATLTRFAEEKAKVESEEKIAEAPRPSDVPDVTPTPSDADVVEENIAGANFDDEELRGHTEDDVTKNSQ